METSHTDPDAIEELVEDDSVAAQNRDGIGGESLLTCDRAKTYSEGGRLSLTSRW
jgi:hypothetical protein